ncbi:MAG: hypothetical protein IKN55_02025 [Oscillospiraceae bacterium]|nr:hypothetical protein [Oscillospiraceae bacterium]
MKLYFTLHETSELQTDLPLEEADERLRNAYGMYFTGKLEEDQFQMEHVDRNPFRPQITVRLQLTEDGVLAVADMKLHRMMLIFLCAWSLIVIAAAAWKGWLLLVMLIVFWCAGIVGFSLGVRDAKAALLEVLEAVEIIG